MSKTHEQVDQQKLDYSTVNEVSRGLNHACHHRAVNDLQANWTIFLNNFELHSSHA
jgi:hypothetical protein